MNRILMAAVIGLVLALAAAAQTDKPSPEPADKMRDVSKVKVKHIRRVAQSAALENKPGVEIELESPHTLYVGGLEWCLHIGKLQLPWPVRRQAGPHETLTYTLPMADWNKLKGGEPLSLGWGCEESGTHIGALNKKMLDKK